MTAFRRDALSGLSAPTGLEPELEPEFEPEKAQAAEKPARSKAGGPAMPGRSSKTKTRRGASGGNVDLDDETEGVSGSGTPEDPEFPEDSEFQEEPLDADAVAEELLESGDSPDVALDPALEAAEPIEALLGGGLENGLEPEAGEGEPLDADDEPEAEELEEVSELADIESLGSSASYEGEDEDSDVEPREAPYSSATSGKADAAGSRAKAPRAALARKGPTSLAATRDSLHLYLREIGKFPILKPEEEVALARQVRDAADQDAAFRLVSSHLRLVVKIAMDFQRRWMQNVLDLIQEGNIGLMRALQKFDPEKGIKFSYYAAFWIKAYILKFIMDNWRMVKIGTTQAQRKLFYNLSKERQRLESLGFDPTAEALSKSLNVSEADVRDMEQRLRGGDVSLDVPLGEDSSSTRMDFLPAVQPGVEFSLAQNEIADLVRTHLEEIRPYLSEKEKDILANRLLSDSPVTLREIGEKYGVTRERVRQIEARLLQKLREHLSRRIVDFSEEWIAGDE